MLRILMSLWVLLALLPSLSRSETVEEYVKRCIVARPRQLRDKPFYLPMREIKAGAIGTLGNNHHLWSVTALQVIDKENVLASIEYGIATVPTGGGVNLGGEAVWLKGVSTEGVVDNRAFPHEGKVYQVVGTKQYPARNGTSTVFVLEQLNIGERFGRQSKKPLSMAEPEKIEVRKWSDASGSFSIEASFAGLSNGMVRLKKTDGSEVNVPLEKLSEADREWISSRKSSR